MLSSVMTPRISFWDGQNWDRVRALTNVRASTLNSSTAVMIPLHVVTLHTFVKTLM